MRLSPLPLLLFSALCLSSQTFSPQPEKQAMVQTVQDLYRAMEAYPRNPESRDSYAKCLLNLEWFVKAANDWQPSPEDEARALRRAFQKMKQLLDQRRDNPEQTAQTLRDLADDLDDKRLACRALGLNTRPMVEVRPKKNGITEVRGLEVWYIEKFLASDPSAHPRRFPTFSSPVTDQFVPGRYVFWAADPNHPQAIGPKTEQRVVVSAPPFIPPLRFEVLAP